MAIKLSDKPNTETPDVDYEFGNIRDRVGTTPGTPVSTEVYADFHQFFERLMQKAEITHNGLPDNSTNEYQLVKAFARLANGNSFSNIYSIDQNGTSNPTINSITQTNLLPFTGVSAVRTGAGDYEISFTPSLATADGLPIAIMLVASSGQASSSLGETIDCRMNNGKILITTQMAGLPTDSILDNYVFELKLISQDNLY